MVTADSVLEFSDLDASRDALGGKSGGSVVRFYARA